MTDLFTLNRPLPEQTASYEFKIFGTDTDNQDRLHLFALFSYMQEAAYYHAEQLKLGAEVLDRENLCWILLRTAIRLSRLPRWGSSIHLKTWQRGVDKLVFLRDFLLSDEQEGSFGIASTEWLIASRETHRPQRPDRVLPSDRLPSLSLPVFDLRSGRLKDRIILSSERPVISRYADFSDIDRNHHVNNTRYIAWIMDALAAFIRQSKANQGGQLSIRAKNLDIQFVSEVVLGQKVDVYVQQSEIDQSFFWIEGRHASDQKTVFRAEAALY